MNLNARARAARHAPIASMEDLAASIAHEVNQPLAAIVVNAECCLLLLRKDQPDLELARKAAERIVRNGQHASEVIRSVRAMLGNTNGDMSPADLNEVVADTLELLATEIGTCQVALETQFSAGASTVSCDRTQIQQVLRNLVRNAVEAMCGKSDFPRTLRVRTATEPAGHVTVSVSDSGPGLDPVTAQRIFEPFFTTKSGGMGLGLAICRSIIESHGGRLSVTPHAPHGSTFEFTLPAHGQY